MFDADLTPGNCNDRVDNYAYGHNAEPGTIKAGNEKESNERYRAQRTRPGMHGSAEYRSQNSCGMVVPCIRENLSDTRTATQEEAKPHPTATAATVVQIARHTSCNAADLCDPRFRLDSIDISMIHTCTGTANVALDIGNEVPSSRPILNDATDFSDSATIAIAGPRRNMIVGEKPLTDFERSDPPNQRPCRPKPGFWLLTASSDDDVAPEPRRIFLTNLPSNCKLRSIANIVYGGALESIESIASVEGIVVSYYEKASRLDIHRPSRGMSAKAVINIRPRSPFSTQTTAKNTTNSPKMVFLGRRTRIAKFRSSWTKNPQHSQST